MANGAITIPISHVAYSNCYARGSYNSQLTEIEQHTPSGNHLEGLESFQFTSLYSKAIQIRERRH